MSAPPFPPGYRNIHEGVVDILLPAEKTNEAFYNKAQVVNRDMSIAVLSMFSIWRQREYSSGSRTREAKASRVRAAKYKRRNVGVDVEDGMPRMNILEGLSATGIRALRYACELPRKSIDKIYANDISPDAAEAIKRSVEYNRNKSPGYHGIEDWARVCDTIVVSQSDVNRVLMENEEDFDVVDIDPYGSPHLFLESAVQNVCEGGMLNVTATDMAVLCGNYPETCITKYGSMPLRGGFSKESALRILLNAINSAANRHKRYIVPILSLSVDFYVRVFVRVFSGAAEANRAALEKSYIYKCVGCCAFHEQPISRSIGQGGSTDIPVRAFPGRGPPESMFRKKPMASTTGDELGDTNKSSQDIFGRSNDNEMRFAAGRCQECGGAFKMGGPFWSGPLHDMRFVSETLKYVNSNRNNFPAFKRISALLTTVLEEIEGPIFYIEIPEFCKFLKVPPPKLEMLRSALLHKGYKVSATHENSQAIKTDAPSSVLIDIARCWNLQLNPSLSPESILRGDRLRYDLLVDNGRIIQPSEKADFSRAKGAILDSARQKITRYPANPPNWGPLSRAGSKHNMIRDEDLADHVEVKRHRSEAIVDDETN